MKNLSDKQLIRLIREPDSPATEAQLKYLRGLKVEIPDGITKSQAAVLINKTVKGAAYVK